MLEYTLYILLLIEIYKHVDSYRLKYVAIMVCFS